MSRLLLPALLIGLAHTLHAQSAVPDSLVQFRAAMHGTVIKHFPPPISDRYVLAWKEEWADTAVIYLRGDGSTLADLLNPDGTFRTGHGDRPSGITNFGNRYALVWLQHAGTNRYTQWYFEYPR